MALFPLNPGLYPLGQFDLLDTELSLVKGGEVMTLVASLRSNTAAEQAAFDAQDGYVFDVTSVINNRPAASRAGGTNDATQFPLFLADDGIAGYGTLLGTLLGTNAGINSTGSTLGPSTAAASGKMTLWDKPGLYAVSIDAVAADFLTSVTIGAYAGLQPGTVLGFGGTGGSSADRGKLAHNSCANKIAASGVAHFVEFESAPTSNSMASLVTTPGRLVGATEIFNRVIVSYMSGIGVCTL